MRDILIDGLPILDLLEVTPSTSNVALLTNCDQSSVSRIYRHVSSSLQLGFRKRNGTYRAHTNTEILASLRQATQLLRLQRGSSQLQWVGTGWNGAALAALDGPVPLPRRWRGEQRTLELLSSRVLDLAVVDLEAVNLASLQPSQLEHAGQPVHFDLWSAVPLARYPLALRAALAQPRQPGSDRPPLSLPGGNAEPTAAHATDAVLVRREHLGRAAIQTLIAQLQQAYRASYGHLPGIRWP